MSRFPARSIHSGKSLYRGSENHRMPTKPGVESGVKMKKLSLLPAKADCQTIGRLGRVPRMPEPDERIRLPGPSIREFSA